MRKALDNIAEIAAETLWPTRCAICDAPGAVLCDRCRASLPYIDWWRACKRCGGAFGAVQCSECSSLALAHLNRTELPYVACASALMFDERSGKLVRTYKDAGEQRLAPIIAQIMGNYLPPDWPCDALTFVPASQAALQKRGFDHMELVARHLSSELDMPCLPAFERPRTKDQRGLTRAERISNLTGRFRVRPQCFIEGLDLLLIDDVYTTGATLCDATDALLARGAHEVRCLTLARV